MSLHLDFNVLPHKKRYIYIFMLNIAIDFSLYLIYFFIILFTQGIFDHGFVFTGY